METSTKMKKLLFSIILLALLQKIMWRIKEDLPFHALGQKEPHGDQLVVWEKKKNKFDILTVDWLRKEN